MLINLPLEGGWPVDSIKSIHGYPHTGRHYQQCQYRKDGKQYFSKDFALAARTARTVFMLPVMSATIVAMLMVFMMVMVLMLVFMVFVVWSI